MTVRGKLEIYPTPSGPAAKRQGKPHAICKIAFSNSAGAERNHSKTTAISVDRGDPVCQECIERRFREELPKIAFEAVKCITAFCDEFCQVAVTQRVLAPLRFALPTCCL